MSVESVTIFVLRASDFTRTRFGVNLEDSIVGSINIGIDTHAEEMLVIVRIDSWIDFGTPAVGVLAGIHGVGVQNTGEFDFELDSAVLVEYPVDAIFIVCRGENV